MRDLEAELEKCKDMDNVHVVIDRLVTANAFRLHVPCCYKQNSLLMHAMNMDWLPCIALPMSQLAYALVL